MGSSSSKPKANGRGASNFDDTKIDYFIEVASSATSIKSNGRYGVVTTATSGTSGSVDFDITGDLFFAHEEQTASIVSGVETVKITLDDLHHVLKDGRLKGRFGVTVAADATSTAKITSATAAQGDSNNGVCLISGHFSNGETPGTLTLSTAGVFLELCSSPGSFYGKGSCDYSDITTSSTLNCNIIARTGFQLTSKITLNATAHLFLSGCIAGNEVAISGNGAQISLYSQTTFITEAKAVDGAINETLNFIPFKITGSANLVVNYVDKSSSKAMTDFWDILKACKKDSRFTGTITFSSKYSKILYDYDQAKGTEKIGETY